MTDFISNTNTENTDYSSAFPPLQAYPVYHKKFYQNSTVNHSSSTLHQQQNLSHPSTSTSNNTFFTTLTPPKYPNYLKHTNYSKLVFEQYHHLQNKKRSKYFNQIEYNRDLEEIDFRLPQYWNKNDKSRHIEVGLNGFESTFTGLCNGEPGMIRTNFPIRPQCGIYYFEISILSTGIDGLFSMGLATSTTKLDKLPGSEVNSFGYHGQNGFAYNQKGLEYGPSYKKGDVVGCCVDFSNNTIFFTKNGISLGIAFHNLLSTSIFYYPCVGLGTPNEKITANFGQDPFVFDIVQYIKEQQKMQFQTINKEIIPTHPRLKYKNDIKAQVDRLIFAYLNHQGYVNTCEAFKQNVQHVKQVDLVPTITTTVNNDDSIRIQIRKAIMSGSIDIAIEQTDSYFPALLESHPDLLFQLKSRKFVEFFLQQEEQGIPRNRRASNFSIEDPVTTPPVSASGRRLSWAAIAASPTSSFVESAMNDDKKRVYSRRNSYQSITSVDDDDDDRLFKMRKAIEYGQLLQEEYQHIPKYLDQLMDLFGLLSCPDPKSSPLLDLSLRDSVASDLNNAIQAYQNHNEVSNLESLFKQCIATNKELALSGHGEASLLPIQDYLSNTVN